MYFWGEKANSQIFIPRGRNRLGGLYQPMIEGDGWGKGRGV